MKSDIGIKIIFFTLIGLRLAAQQEPKDWQLLCDDIPPDSCLSMLLTNPPKEKSWYYYNYIGNLHFNIGQYTEATKYFNHCIRDIQLVPDSAKVEIYNNLGICADETQQYPVANAHYMEAIKYARKGSDSLMNLSNIYTNLGILHTKASNLETALHYQKKTLQIDQQILPANDPWLETDQFNLAHTMGYLGDYHQEIQLLKTILAKRMDRGADPEKISNVLTNLSVAFRKNDQLDTALLYSQKSLAFDKEIGDTNLIYNDYYNHSLIFIRSGRLATAQHYLDTLYFLSTKLPDSTREIRRLDFLQAQIAEKSGHQSQADHWYRKTMESYQQNIINLIGDELNDYNLLVSNYVQFLAKQNQEQALAIIINTVSISDVKKITQDYAESAENSFPILKNLISLGCEISYALFEKERDNQYLQQFYYLSEHKKAFYLYRDYLKFSSHQVSIDPSLEERGNKILRLRGKLNYLREKKLEDSINIYENELIENSLKWQEGLSNLNNANKIYPYGKIESSLTEVIRWSTIHNTSILSYLFTDSSLFSLVITPDTVQLIRHDPDSNISQKVSRYSKLIESFGSLQYQPEKIIEDSFRYLLNLSSQLHTSVFEPASSILQDNIVIIPDDFLFDLPFSTLCIRPSSQSTIQPDDFLVTNKTIALHFSIQALITTPSNFREKSPLLFIAPFQERHTSGPKWFLPYSKRELQEVKQIVKVVNPNVTDQKRAILSQVENSAFIHLASHAFIDESHPSNYFLAVGPQMDNYDNRLYLDEIYTLRKEPGLMVLNACETNRSSSVIQSFTRAFYLSGAGQVVSNNWKISDQSAIALVKHIYQNLVQGKSATESLTAGKISYLRNHSGLALHPHYWGNLDIWGWDQSATNLIKSGRKYQILLGISVLLLLIFMLRIKRETSRT